MGSRLLRAGQNTRPAFWTNPGFQRNWNHVSINNWSGLTKLRCDTLQQRNYTKITVSFKWKQPCCITFIPLTSSRLTGYKHIDFWNIYMNNSHYIFSLHFNSHSCYIVLPNIFFLRSNHRKVHINWLLLKTCSLLYARLDCWVTLLLKARTCLRCLV